MTTSSPQPENTKVSEIEQPVATSIDIKNTEVALEASECPEIVQNVEQTNTIGEPISPIASEGLPPVEQTAQTCDITQRLPSSDTVCSGATLVYQEPHVDHGGYPAYSAPTKAFMAKRREPVKLNAPNSIRVPRHPQPTEPEKYEQPQEPYIPLAVRIRQTALRTPSRFRCKPDPVCDAPACRKQLPQTPLLTARFRTRSACSLEPPVSTYKANPVDKRALQSRGEVGVPRMKRRPPTIPRSPHFSSKKQKNQLASRSSPEAASLTAETQSIEALEQVHLDEQPTTQNVAAPALDMNAV